MTATLRVLSAGPGVTIQDGGRHGYLRYGVTVAGPMDPLAHAVANRALGNPADSAAIEISLGGLEVTAEGEALTIAVAGGMFQIALDGQALPPAVVMRLEPGATLRLRAGAAGVWCYLAVAGGLAVPPILGSRATHARTGMGGLEGRMLAAGDRLLSPRHPAARSRRASSSRRGSTGRATGFACSWPAARLLRRRPDRGLPRRPMANFGAGRPHGLLSGRAEARPQARLQHPVGRRRHGSDPGARRGAAHRPDGGPAIDRRLSQDRDRHRCRSRPPRPGKTRNAARLQGGVAW